VGHDVYSVKTNVTERGGKVDKGEDLIRQFRISTQLRIAVTVGMVATNPRIKPLECLLFLCDVRNRVFFD